MMTGALTKEPGVLRSPMLLRIMANSSFTGTRSVTTMVDKVDIIQARNSRATILSLGQTWVLPPPINSSHGPFYRQSNPLSMAICLLLLKLMAAVENCNYALTLSHSLIANTLVPNPKDLNYISSFLDSSV